MKKWIAILLTMVLLFSLVVPISAAEENMAGDGGDTENVGGGGGHFWNGEDGVRVSVYHKESKKMVGTCFDYTSFAIPTGVISFAKKTKLQYLAGAQLAPMAGKYLALRPSTPLPKIVSDNGSSNIVAIKSYFTDESTIKDVADKANIPYETLINGEYTIVVEPLAIFSYNRIKYAMTATEAALYNQQTNGNLSKYLGNLTHQNLPLALFLERDELGIRAWGGGGGRQPTNVCISYLGIGTVNFDDEELPGELPEEPKIEETYDYIYHADTDVVTSITISTSSEINPDNAGRATFRLPDKTVTKEYVIPENDSQLVWVKWHTPDEETTVEIPVSVSGGTAEKVTINCKIIKFEENPPPNPEGRDRNDTFSKKNPPQEELADTLEWGEWWATWHENWVWHSKPCPDSGGGTNVVDSRISTGRFIPRMKIGGFGKPIIMKKPSGGSGKCGEWVDEGWWDFHWRPYKAQITISAHTNPDERVPTANGNDMKSGYGVNAEVQVQMTTNGGDANTTPVQYVVATFPEFYYDTFNRFLEPENGQNHYVATWEFQENEFSQTSNRVHFTPIWYPDNSDYPVAFEVFDTWTPAGELKCIVISNDVTINGNVYDDWHIAPEYN